MPKTGNALIRRKILYFQCKGNNFYKNTIKMFSNKQTKTIPIAFERKKKNHNQILLSEILFTGRKSYFCNIPADQCKSLLFPTFEKTSVEGRDRIANMKKT